MTKNFIVGELDNFKYVYIVSKSEGKWVLSFNRNRQRWECPGGHVEPGEGALEAARRELWEETGAAEYDIFPIWDFQALNEDGSVHNNGRAYFADIKCFDPLPAMSEMERIGFFEELPEDQIFEREAMENTLKRAELCWAAFFE